MRLVRLEGDAVARDPGVLADEAYAISMFGGDRAIWIDAQGRDLLPALEPLFARPPTDCTIVIKAGQLKKGTGFKGRVRKLARAGVDRVLCRRCEHARSPHQCGSPRRRAGDCADARAALVHMVGADRRTTRGEITKLMLYAQGQSANHRRRRGGDRRRRRPVQSRRSHRPGAARRSARGRDVGRPVLPRRGRCGLSDDPACRTD